MRIRYESFKIVIVDDGSTDGSAQYIQEHCKDAVILIGDGQLWWAGATNLGIRWALDREFDYILMYNDDQVCDPDFLSRLIQEAKLRPKSLLSPYVYYLADPRRLLSGGIHLERGSWRTSGVGNECIVNEPLPEAYKVDAVPGYAMLVPAFVFRQVGLFDDDRFPQIFMELDFCLRAQNQGFFSWIVPAASVWNDRSDKDEDPIGSCNPIRRLLWLTQCKNLNLHFAQNLNLGRLLMATCNRRAIFPAIKFSIRYVIKLLRLSLLSKPQARRLRKQLGLNRDKWA